MPRSFAPERPSPDAGDERASRAPAPLTSLPPPSTDSVRDITQEDFLFHLYRGSELLQENRVLEAKEELEHALTMQPLDAKGQDLLAAVYFRLGLYPRAIQIYESLAEQFPRDVSVKINLGLALLKTGQPERARAALKEAVTLNPEHKRAWGYLGLALQKLGELEQAQLAFQRGGRLRMAQQVTESRLRSLLPPSLAAAPAAPVDPGVHQVFSELDASEITFSVAPEPAAPGDGPWQMLEIGDATADAPAAPATKTQPFVSARDAGTDREAPIVAGGSLVARGPASMADEAFAHTRLVPPPPAHAPHAAGAGTLGPPSGAPPRIPSLLEAFGGAKAPSLALHPSGVLLARTSPEPARALAGRIDAVRVVAGAAAPQMLRRRVQGADTTEVLGGLGSPMVRFDGSAQIVLAARASAAIALLGLDDELAFVREDHLLAFELSLAYENGKLALEPPGEGHTSAEGSPIVQLRGTGGLALEVVGALTSIASAPDRPLLVRREWIVGWVGRLMPRAVGAAEAPNGQRGLISFSGEGAVLVRVGG